MGDDCWAKLHEGTAPTPPRSEVEQDAIRDILARIRTRYQPVAAWDDNPAVLRLSSEEGIPATVVRGWDGAV